MATMEQRIAALSAAQAFVDWINGTGHQDNLLEPVADIPDGYQWSLSDPGKRYIRIVMSTHADETGARKGQSSHAFVDLETGDLLKCAGWKAPAKGARGNLIDGMDDVKHRFTWSGGYLYKGRS